VTATEDPGVQEEQRKVSNMNDCRDAWARLMRTAADQQAQPLQAPSATQGKARLQLDPMSGTRQHYSLSIIHKSCCIDKDGSNVPLDLC